MLSILRKAAASIAALLLLAAPASATSPKVINLLPSDYNAGNKNWAMDEDKNGTIYIGNDKGLLEFDGLQWTLYEHPKTSLVRAVKVYSEDCLFTGGFEEFGRWDRDRSGRLVYTSLSAQCGDDVPGDSDFWKILLTKDGVIFQSFTSMFLYDFKTVKAIPCDRNILFLLQADDRLWVQKMGDGIFRLEGMRMERIKGSEIFSNTTVRVLLPDAKGRDLLIGTGTNGIWRYDGRDFHRETSEISRKLTAEELNCAIKTSRGTYMWGTLLGGVYETDGEGRILRRLSSQNRLLNNCVLNLMEDDEQNIWIALDRGLSCLKYHPGIDFKTYNRWEIGSIYDVCRWQGKLLLGTNQGVFHIEERLLDKGTSPDDFKPLHGINGQIWSFSLIDGRLYVCSNSGIFEVGRNLQLKQIIGIGGYQLKEVELNGRKHKFFASYYQLRKLAGQDRIIALDGLDEAVYRIESDYMNNLWVEHYSKGIFRCRLNDECDKIESAKFYGGGTADSLPYKLHLFKVGGRVAMFGDDRFFRYNEFTDRIEPDTVLDNTFHGQKDIRLIVPYATDKYWVMTDNGILRLEYDGVQEVRLRTSDGIPVKNSIYGYERISIPDAETAIFCGDDGFEIVHAEKIEEMPRQKAPRIKAIKAYGTHERTVWMEKQGEQRIPFSHNSIKFYYTSNHCRKFEDISFRHRLLGVDDQWSKASRDGAADYARLSMGSYTFEVVACDAFGNCSAPTVFRFEILAPWYRSNIAYLGYFIVSILLFVLAWFLFMRFYRRRYLRHLRLQEITSLRHANKTLKQELTDRNAEILSQSSTLIGRNEMILHLRDMVNDHQGKYGTHATAQLCQKINSYVTSKLDTENDLTLFLIKFEQKHANYFHLLKEKYPELTNNDLRLSACLKMNLCTKEIASLMGLSVRAVENNRYRLRKKLGLNQEQNLNLFLLDIDRDE